MVKLPRAFPRKISKYIWKSDVTHVFDLEEQVIQCLGKTRLSQVEKVYEVENLVETVDEKLQEYIEEAYNKGVIPRFTRSHTSTRYIGCAVKNREEKESGSVLKDRLMCLDKIHSFIQKISWSQFEAFCNYIMNLYGAERFGVGPKSRDGGLDFYATFKVTPITRSSWWYVHQSYQRPKGWIGLLDPFEIRVFGQAKHRSKSVTQKDMNDFSKKVDDFVSNESIAIKNLPQSFIESKAPLIPLMMTNAVFDKGSIERADKDQIHLRNGNQLVYDLIMLDNGELFDEAELHLDRFDRFLADK